MVAASSRFSPVRRQKKKGWDRAVFLDDRETADIRSQTKARSTGPVRLKERNKQSGSNWFLAGEQFSNASARLRSREQKNLDRIGFLKANELVGSDVRS